MSQFKVSPDELRGHAGTLDNFAANANTNFVALRGRLDSLEASFQGQSARKFTSLMEEWQTSAQALTQALAALGKVLSDEAAATEALDAEMAGGVS